MRAVYLIFFASLVSSSWCGLFDNDFTDKIQSKLNDLQEETNQNLKAVGISTDGQQGITSGFDSTIPNYGKQNSMGGILENIGNEMSSHQIMKQESDGMKFASQPDNNLFGNVQGVFGSSSSSFLSSISSARSSLFGSSLFITLVAVVLSVVQVFFPVYV